MAAHVQTVHRQNILRYWLQCLVYNNTASAAHPEGGDMITEYEESFDNGITNLIEKWEELGGGGSRVEEEV